MSILASAGVTAGAQLVSQGINAISTGSMNRRTRRFTERMWNLQGQRELDYWNLQNAYNDPSAQMARLRNAGLNPNLVYGTGATTEAAGLQAKQAHQANFKAPQIDLASVAQQAIMTRQAEANIRRTNAETEAIETRTAGHEFQNELNRTIGIDKMVERYDWATDEIAIRSQKANAEFEAWKASGFGKMRFDDPNSPLAKAQRAGLEKSITDLENARKLGDLRQSERVIKEFEANLARNGISPNSPWYAKILGTLLIEAMPSIQKFLKF